MRPSEALAKHRETIRRLILEGGLANPRVFGSAIHGDDREGSDLDLLIEAPRGVSLFGICKVQIELEKQLGMSVDLVTANSLHPKIRTAVLAEAVPI